MPDLSTVQDLDALRLVAADPSLLASGPIAARFYTQNGFRVVPIDPGTKAASRRGFGKDAPTFSTPPNDFRWNELVAILMGPCPLGTFAGGRFLCGLDLDTPFDRAALERRTGALPETLSSKKGRHLYFWITPDQQKHAELAQGNDIFRTKLKNEGACDLRSASGGYFLERGDWDGGFAATRIRDLPDHAHNVLLAARTVRKGKPQAVCPVAIDRYADGERTPMNDLGESVLDHAARALAGVWPRPGQGGGHDLALALGGVLADAWGSLDDVCDFAARVFHYAQAPNAVQEVLASVSARRTGSANAFGWPTLNRMLVDANPGIDPAIVRTALNRLKKLPGLDSRISARHSAIVAFRDAGCPGAQEIGRDAALAAFTAEWKAKGGTTTPPDQLKYQPKPENTTAPDAIRAPGAATNQRKE